MEAQVANKTAEPLVLQCCASKDGIKFMQAWKVAYNLRRFKNETENKNKREP